MNKIILFSEESDHTTSDIISWLYFFKFKKVFRINIDDPYFKVININPNFVRVKTSFTVFEIYKKDIVWFRRSPGKKINLVKVDTNLNGFDIQLGIFNNLEKDSITESLYYWILSKCKVIANPFNSSVSKIDVLLIAESLKINVPKWVVCSSKKDLKVFASNCNQIVQKTFNHFNYHNQQTKESYYLYTKLIDNINEFETNFQESFFQEYIDKKYEIRSFFWNDKFYSMAIFSQNDSQTKIDFRNYNRNKPNRTVPITLPKEYSKKIKSLIKKLQLDTCSIDTLVTNKNEYFFLEVNPIGQFGMVSKPCNYMIEKIIAKDLIKKAKNEKFKKEHY